MKCFYKPCANSYNLSDVLKTPEYKLYKKERSTIPAVVLNVFFHD